MVRIKYSDGLWKPAVISDKHDIRSYTGQTPSGGFCKIAVCFLWLSLPGECRVTDEALLAETT